MKQSKKPDPNRLAFYLTALRDLQSALASRRGAKLSETSLRECLYRVMGTVASARGLLLTWDKDKNQLVVRARKGFRTKVATTIELSPAEAKRLGSAAHPFDLGLAGGGLAALAGRLSDAYRRFGPLLAVPLASGRGAGGVILLGAPIGPAQAFTSDGRDVLAHMGLMIGGALADEQTRVKLSSQARRHRDQSRHMRRIYLETVRMLAGLIDGQSDPEAAGHSARVAALAAETGRQLGFKPEACERLYLAGLLHDIGKQVIRQDILGRKGPLRPNELEIVRRHPEIAYELISHIQFPWGDVAEIVRHHHERLDGGGYPDRLEGAKISTDAKILILAEAFDAMTSEQPWRPRMRIETVVSIISGAIGMQFEAEIVEALCRALDAALAGELKYDDFAPNLFESGSPEIIEKMLRVLRGELETHADRPLAEIIEIQPGASGGGK